ncbi:MAG: SDR family oxidoreductase [Candidatus Omnitrophota bacterium]
MRTENTERKVIVTGGAGFIGSHLVDYLVEKGCEVTVIDNFSTGRRSNLKHIISNIRLVEADVTNFEAILPHFQNKDIVFHLAALADIVPSIVNPLNYYRSNVNGTINVMEAVRLSKVKKVVYSASSSCYGIPSEEPRPTSETDPINPQYPYAHTKFLGEEIVLHYGKIYEMPVVSLRLFNVYGPRSRTSGTYGAVFGVFLAQKLKNSPYTVVGDGTQTRDFIYVRDVAHAFAKAGFSDVKNEVFNVGSGNPQSVNKLVSLLGGDKIHIPKRPGEPEYTWADISKIAERLSWQAEVSFEEGVERIVKKIDYWQSAPVWTPDTIENETKEWFRYLTKGV